MSSKSTGFLSDLRNGFSRCGVVNQRLLIGVSGGADSVALLRGTLQLAGELSLVVCVAHLNHRLRRTASDDDAVWVKSLADAHGCQVEIGELPSDTLSLGQAGLEEHARTLRHRFYETTASTLNCSVVALGHSADDQAETVLHHLVRGTGLAGLRGIPSVRQTASGLRLVRPMLSVRRQQIEDYLQELAQDYRTDATNQDTSLTRNRLRHVILPLLREQLNPQVDQALCRLAEQAREVDEVIQQAASDLLAKCLTDRLADLCRINIAPLQGQPNHLVREVFREIWRRQGWPRQAMGYEQWNRLLDVLATRETITLPDRIDVRFHTDNLLVIRRIAADARINPASIQP